MVSFIKSAVVENDYPIHSMSEVAIVGRSNAGKSSFINLLAQRKIAKVSQVPGKTRLLNFFQFPSYVLVDMPGYGFASRSGGEMRDWQKMIEDYLLNRKNLQGLILIMDIRREWSEEETQIHHFAFEQKLPMLIVLNKTDKLSKSQKLQAIEKLKKMSGLETVFTCSVLKKEGHKEIEEFFFNNWIKF